MKFLSALLPFAPLVAAHGYVDKGVIGGQTIQFYQPYQDPYINPPPQRISRPVQGNGPIEDLTLIDVQCGGWSAGGIAGSQPAALHATAAAGSEVTLYWTQWPDSHVGPAITYMARCPDAGCQNWLPGSSAVWFKVHQDGLRSGGTWGATPLMAANNAGYKFTIPQCLAPGSYLVRHELVALHAAWAYPGAQFYPSCFQVRVTGSGTARPSGLVSFPGAYKATDPGVVFDVYRGATSYPVPGPAVFRC
ncbi:cellulose-growth-specific protein [Plectosphaerella cucumerina]|uniref:lytic cellulose monooxygenase (C4-dehydrogenating) n=1 Tax=Plectosphaerella cucumerina TaxID=40658 RepID=A0A8K0TQJ9_9PEZI|nr:cellulose-growth-specific protein [Plectosphaerella cucumerina]